MLTNANAVENDLSSFWLKEEDSEKLLVLRATFLVIPMSKIKSIYIRVS